MAEAKAPRKKKQRKANPPLQAAVAGDFAEAGIGAPYLRKSQKGRAGRGHACF